MGDRTCEDLLETDHVRIDLLYALGQQRPALLPAVHDPPQVERGHAELHSPILALHQADRGAWPSTASHSFLIESLPHCKDRCRVDESACGVKGWQKLHTAGP